MNKLKFLNQYLKFRSLLKKSKRKMKILRSDLYPCLEDDTVNVGFDKHYIYHTAWASRRVLASSPKKHIDIGSSLYFVSMVSSIVPVKHYDFRAPDVYLDKLETGSMDLLNIEYPSNSIKSLSCMHVIEHVGLGRYGDSLNINGDLEAAKELSRVLSLNGLLYIVLPVGGRSKVHFNAHRVYGYEEVLRMFSGLSLVEFSVLTSRSNGILEHIQKDEIDNEYYACGMFIFTKENEC